MKYSNSANYTWDIFCRVIDNFGDIGVCWRLCADLANRGHQVRLWADDASALSWMTTLPQERINVLPWPSTDEEFARSLAHNALGDIVIEAFGCELPDFVQAEIAKKPTTLWINLEYLSAESYVERSHGLPSPVMSDPAKGLTKWFFYPGFTQATGGLLREQDLVARQAVFDPNSWRLQMGLPIDPNALWMSVFCYDNADLAQVLQTLRSFELNATESPFHLRPIHWLITPGKASIAFKDAQRHFQNTTHWPDHWHIHDLPYLTQKDFDHLLWICDLNIVRGEDSLVRAIWANRAFLWHIYPQDDLAHHDKLNAFLDLAQAPEISRVLHAQLNGISFQSESTESEIEKHLLTLTQNAQNLGKYLSQQDDLISQLIAFSYQKLPQPVN